MIKKKIGRCRSLDFQIMCPLYAQLLICRSVWQALGLLGMNTAGKAALEKTDEDRALNSLSWLVALVPMKKSSFSQSPASSFLKKAAGGVCVRAQVLHAISFALAFLSCHWVHPNTSPF